MTYPINALYGHGYSYDPVSDGYADATTTDTVQKMNALYSGPGGALRSLRNAIPENTDLPAPQFFMDPRSLSMTNMVRSGLGTAANWLQGNPEIGPDTLAPLGLGSMGTGLANALTRAAPDAGIARSLSHQFPGEPAIGDMIRTRIAGANRIGVSGEDGMTPLARTDGAMRSPGDAVNRAPYGMGRPANDLLADNAKSSVPGTVVNSMAEQPKTIRAYHGSSHDFDKFSMEKIGTGEGSQSFGPGLYFAENPKTADSYRPRSWNPFAKRPGRSYEVDIKARPEDFVDLDVPMSAQPKPLQEALLRVADEQMTRNGWPESYKQYMREQIAGGGTSQDSLNHLYGTFYRDKDTPGAWERDAAKALNDAGVKGTRFFDSGSRGKKHGTRNYVVFDDSLVDTKRKYARSDVASAPGLAANSTQQQDSGVTDILRKYGLIE
jgi:hypothetical protein